MRLRLRDGDHHHNSPCTPRRGRSCNAAPSQGRRSRERPPWMICHAFGLQCGSVSGTEITAENRCAHPGHAQAAMRLRLRDGDHEAGDAGHTPQGFGAAMRLRLRDGDHLTGMELQCYDPMIELQCGSVSGTEITVLCRPPHGAGRSAAMRLRLRDGDHESPLIGSTASAHAAMRLRLRDGDHGHMG